MRRLAALDPHTLTVAEWRSATTLLVLSIHDTMNHTARPDGAVCLERDPKDRLPAVVALSNRGDGRGELRSIDTDGLRADIDVPTLDGAWLRSIGTAYRRAFDAHAADDIGYNRPYLGGYETQVAGPRLRALAARSVVRSADGITRTLHLGAWQNEFLREFLLGPEATAAMMEPGTEWVPVPDERVHWLAERLKAAHDLVRGWGTALDA